ncbi:PilW family protein [Pseudogulbenkiania subflava]|uniref:Type IV pilus assembly protein PilW n=1 Tax=Pseudogulbenkiania subflava DSM 22618 TaxID=1123014 RepID=A0A1Y6C8V7_9NEIS|nr:prepilin-type N-terminal cleavage/methylation domain-containing protein [Pseudogulbenkiania subflava]SMF41985.1 type IV pilus assembly protein PilW [Pseudogulbenkiania subflava DSM 22618]
MNQPHLRSPRRQSGISLIEIMIGLTIALITTLMLSQIMGLWWNQRKTTDSASEGQNQGLTSMVLMEQAIRSAGYGTQIGTLINCAQSFSYVGTNGANGGPDTFTGASFGTSIAPLLIVDGGTNGEADQILVRNGKGNISFGLTTLRDDMPKPSSTLKVNSVSGFEVATFSVLYHPPGITPNDPATTPLDESKGYCTRFDLTASNGQALTLQQNPGQNNTNGKVYNPAGDPSGWPGYKSGDYIIKIGSDIITSTYSVDESNRQLKLADASMRVATVNYTLGENIINMQAQYGVKAAGSSTFSWKDAVDNGSDHYDANTLANDSASLTKILTLQAVKLAVVSRVPKRESGIVTTACSGFSNGICIWSGTKVRLDGGAGGTEWQHYKYRIYESVIPLRNTIWSAG